LIVLHEPFNGHTHRTIRTYLDVHATYARRVNTLLPQPVQHQSSNFTTTYDRCHKLASLVFSTAMTTARHRRTKLLNIDPLPRTIHGREELRLPIGPRPHRQNRNPGTIPERRVDHLHAITAL